MSKHQAAEGAPTWVVKERVTNLGLTPSEALTCGDHVSCATVYASMTNQSFPEEAPSVVRVDLEADVGNIRRHIASAFLLPGFNGPCITVTGFPCTSFRVSVSGSQADQRLRLALTTRACCGGFSVHVPAELLEFITTTPALALNRRPPFPWGAEWGQYWFFNSANPDQATELPIDDRREGLRLTHVQAVPMGNAASLTLYPVRGLIKTYNVAPAIPLELLPKGVLEVRALRWQNLRMITLEGVR